MTCSLKFEQRTISLSSPSLCYKQPFLEYVSLPVHLCPPSSTILATISTVRGNARVAVRYITKSCGWVNLFSVNMFSWLSVFIDKHRSMCKFEARNFVLENYVDSHLFKDPPSSGRLVDVEGRKLNCHRSNLHLTKVRL